MKELKLYIPLNIQRFGASGSISCTVNSQNYGANTSNVTITFTVTRTSGTTHWENAKTVNFTIDGVGYTSSLALPSSKTSKSCSITTDIYHNGDGTKTFSYSASIVTGTGAGTITASGTTTLPTIPRYANITSFSVSKRDETSVQFNYSVDSNIDWAWYSTDNGANWGNLPSNNIISGLSVGQTYNFKLRVRRTESQLTTDSGTYSQSTYPYPSINTPPNFTIGNAYTISLNNPLGRSCDVRILDASNNQMASGTTTGTSMTGFNDSTSVTNYYNSIPDAPSGTYKVRLIVSALSRDTTITGGTYSVDVETNKPIMTNFSGSYVADLTSLTNNNQTIINNASTITYTISTGATAQNGASISRYVVTWGSANDTITDISNSASLVKGSGNTISITAYDSRGIPNTASTSISEVVNYTLPTNIAISADRLDGIGEDVYLDVSGTIYYDKFGTNGVSNRITNIKYSITGETAQDVDASLSSIAYSSASLDTHTQKFTIVNAPISIDGQGGGFDTSKTYAIQVNVIDTSGNIVTINGTIKDGRFAMAKGQDSNGDYHIGICGVPDNDYALKVHGNINADNFNYSTNEQVVGTWTDNKPLYRKVYTGSNTDTIMSSSELNGKNIIKVEGWVGDYILNGWNSASGKSTGVYISSASLVLYRGSLVGSQASWHAIVYYTKTT